MTHPICENIRKARRDKGITQEHLAEMIGFSSQSAIARIENSDTPPKVKTIDAIANALDISVLDLLGHDENTAKKNIRQTVYNELFDVMGDDARRINSGAELLDIYSRLNFSGKMSAMLHMRELVQIPAYTEDDNIPKD